MRRAALVVATIGAGVAYSVAFAHARASARAVALTQAAVALATTLVARRRRATSVEWRRVEWRRVAVASALYCASTLTPTLVARTGALSYATATYLRLSSLAFAALVDLHARRTRDALVAGALLVALTQSSVADDATQHSSTTVAVALCLAASAAATALGELQRAARGALASTSDGALLMYAANACVVACIADDGAALRWHGTGWLAATGAAQHACVVSLLDVRERSSTLVPATLAARKLVTYALLGEARVSPHYAALSAACVGALVVANAPM